MEKEFVSEDKNTIIGSMDSSEKAEYIQALDDYFIEYRDVLKAKRNTFGMEVEFEGRDYTEVQPKFDEFTGWKFVPEKDFVVGGEAVSPVYCDNSLNWGDIKDVLTVFQNTNGLDTSHKAGAHVHIGAQGIGSYDNFMKFILLYTVYEDVLYRFGYMDRLNARETMISCAVPLSDELAFDYEGFLESHNIKYIKNRYDRYNGINFKNLSSLCTQGDKNTLEFRFANGTFDPVLWQNYINTCLKLVEASGKKDLDLDKLEYLLFRIRDEQRNYCSVGKLNIEKAIEFCDIIFNNNLDKTNFLRQYIKDGSETVDPSCQKYSKSFTRVI